MLTNYLSLISQPAIQQFLVEHENDDEKILVLKKRGVGDIPSSIMATQLIGRRKAKSKLPSWYTTQGIVYPPTVNLEQCSSEATALYKKNIVNSLVTAKRKAVDLTGGFGVDTLYLSSLFESVHYVDPDRTLVDIVKHNHKQLGATNIVHHCLSAEEYIKHTPFQFDLIYIDPSRRDKQIRKVHKLSDCTPDVTQLQSTLLNNSPFLLLKASPLLDIQQGLRDIQHVKRVYVISVNNECKELLFLLEESYSYESQVIAVDLFENGDVRSSFSFTFSEERNAVVKFGEPDMYLFEPNASILKSGAFKLIAKKFGLTKMDPNTHLYTSSVLIPGFPGKSFQVEALNPNATQLNALLPEKQANVVSRNYPLKPEGIKKKLRLRDGGQKFLLGFSSTKRKHLAVCSRVTST